SLARYWTLPLKDDWRAATPVVLADRPPGTVVLVDSAAEVTSLFHYASPPPAEVIGLDDHALKSETLAGICYVAGTRADATVRDYAPFVFACPEVRLILCVPGRSEDEYRALFGRHGYSVIRADDFHRIRVLSFRRLTLQS